MSTPSLASRRPVRHRSSPAAPPGSGEHAGVSAAVRALRAVTTLEPRLAVILGSGFGGVIEAVEIDAELPYPAIPGLVASGVAGHEGRWIAGRVSGVPVWMLAGRVHYYEGHPMDVVTFPVRVLAALGVTSLLLTNAAGGIARGLRPGDFLRITDHINFMGVNPLRGLRLGGGPAFVDLTRVYDPGLGRKLQSAARRAGIRLRAGVYLAVSGPSYETPAEIRAFARLGADVVGMSTVPEAVVARALGLQVAALSCITNLAAGRSAGAICHQEVLAAGAAARARAKALLQTFIERVGGAPPPGGTRPRRDALETALPGA